ITVPGIGEVNELCSPAWRWAWKAASGFGGAVGAGDARFRRKGVAQGPLGSRTGPPESGGYSVRNAVVVRPSRTAGCETSHRRNGRVFVATPVLRPADAP